MPLNTLSFFLYILPDPARDPREGVLQYRKKEKKDPLSSTIGRCTLYIPGWLQDESLQVTISKLP